MADVQNTTPCQPPWVYTFLHKHLHWIMPLLWAILVAVAVLTFHTEDRLTTLEIKEAVDAQNLSALQQISARLSHIEGALGIGDATRKGN